MKRFYKKISGEKFEKIFIVGDIHGCYTKLMQELQKVNFNFNEDLLICVGDLIDRGPENLATLSLIEKSWFRTVQGNHDQMAVAAVMYGKYSDMNDWKYNGGGWFEDLDLISKNKAVGLLQKLALKPLILELNTVDDKKIIICHADYPFNEYEYLKNIEHFNLTDLTWNRMRVETEDETVIKGADEFYFGHTPMKEPHVYGNRHYIDTGAFSPKGKFTLVRVQ